MVEVVVTVAGGVVVCGVEVVEAIVASRDVVGRAFDLVFVITELVDVGCDKLPGIDTGVAIVLVVELVAAAAVVVVVDDDDAVAG